MQFHVAHVGEERGFKMAPLGFSGWGGAWFWRRERQLRPYASLVPVRENHFKTPLFSEDGSRVISYVLPMGFAVKEVSEVVNTFFVEDGLSVDEGVERTYPALRCQRGSCVFEASARNLLDSQIYQNRTRHEPGRVRGVSRAGLNLAVIHF